jgi:hypothetical protein
MLIATDHVDPLNSPASSEEEIAPADPDPDDLTDSSGESSPQPDHSLDTTHDDISYDHQAAHRTALLASQDLSDATPNSSASDALQSSSRDASLAPSSNPRMSFFDEEYAQGRRVPSPPAAIEIDFEPPEEIDQLRGEIEQILASTGWVPDFQAARIPSLQRDATTHLALQALLTQRVQTETGLNAMYSDEDPDGTPLDPERDLEGDYNRQNPGRDFETDTTDYQPSIMISIVACTLGSWGI